MGDIPVVKSQAQSERLALLQADFKISTAALNVACISNQLHSSAGCAGEHRWQSLPVYT